MKHTVFTVSQVNRYLKMLLDNDELCQSIFVRGEISNYKKYPSSGHQYFSLKDEECSIRCVLFRSDGAKLRFAPENGMKVIAFGRISVYQRDGQYQLICSSLTPDGIGDLYAAFEQLKDRLDKEGLFRQEAKKPLPEYPRKIALVTSGSGAAVHDMIRITGVRYPLAEIVVVPVQVQGKGAAEEIANAIEIVNAMHLADLIITGRGGGSLEDLWAFNEEIVARAIYKSEIPVISAVGHEPDVTIADFVADRRASTPSNAAEIAVPSQEELKEKLRQSAMRMATVMQKQTAQERGRLEALANRQAMRDPCYTISEKREYLDRLWEKMSASMKVAASEHRREYGELAVKLDAMSPFKVLRRGYSFAYDSEGKVITSVKQVEPGDRMKLEMYDGALDCSVTGKEDKDVTERERETK